MWKKVFHSREEAERDQVFIDDPDVVWPVEVFSDGTAYDAVSYRGGHIEWHGNPDYTDGTWKKD